MKTFTRDYRISGNYSKAYMSYFKGMKPCILDIETTGLSPLNCKVCLVALLVRTDTGVRVTQFLAENHYDEYKVLKATLDWLCDEAIDYLITFNGQAFDIPFLRRRLEDNFLDCSLPPYDFDLYRFMAKGSTLRSKLESLSQKSLEGYYGILSDRQDTITGRESIKLFNDYVLSGDPTNEKIILTHNREDVVQLHRLMLLCLSDEKSIHGSGKCEDGPVIQDFDLAMAKLGFLVCGSYSVRPYLSKAKSMLRICGEQLTTPVSAEFFPDMDSNIHAIFNSSSSSFEIDVPVQSHGKDYFIDISKLGLDSSCSELGTISSGRGLEDSSQLPTLADSLASDPDYIGGYLILSSRTINLISSEILQAFHKKL